MSDLLGRFDNIRNWYSFSINFDSSTFNSTNLQNVWIQKIKIQNLYTHEIITFR